MTSQMHGSVLFLSFMFHGLKHRCNRWFHCFWFWDSFHRGHDPLHLNCDQNMKQHWEIRIVRLPFASKHDHSFKSEVSRVVFIYFICLALSTEQMVQWLTYLLTWLTYLLASFHDRAVTVPTHLEQFQKGGDQARPDWQAPHWPGNLGEEYTPAGEGRGGVRQTNTETGSEFGFGRVMHVKHCRVPSTLGICPNSGRQWWWREGWLRETSLHLLIPLVLACVLAFPILPAQRGWKVNY